MQFLRTLGASSRQATTVKGLETSPSPSHATQMSQQSQQTSQTSQTTTQSSEPPTQEEEPRTLRLRGHHTATGRSVQWADDVVDNEGLGRKSSKGSFILSLAHSSQCDANNHSKSQCAVYITSPRP